VEAAAATPPRALQRVTFRSSAWRVSMSAPAEQRIGRTPSVNALAIAAYARGQINGELSGAPARQHRESMARAAMAVRSGGKLASIADTRAAALATPALPPRRVAPDLSQAQRSCWFARLRSATAICCWSPAAE